MRRSALVLCLAVSQQACLGHLLAGIGSDKGGTESYSVPPAEQDAKLQCGGAPCNAVPIEQPYTDGRSRGTFWVVFLAEVAVSAAGWYGGINSNFKETIPWLPMA